MDVAVKMLQVEFFAEKTPKLKNCRDAIFQHALAAMEGGVKML
jgi:hypothetical protein